MMYLVVDTYCVRLTTMNDDKFWGITFLVQMYLKFEIRHISHIENFDGSVRQRIKLSDSNAKIKTLRKILNIFFLR